MAAGSSLSVPEAVRRVYETFAGERLRTPIDHAPTENRRTAAELILSAPLRQLGPEQLDHYAAHAMTTVSDVATYRHFLPRILELAADGAAQWGLEPWMIAGKLVYGSWRGWRDDQQMAVADLFDAAARLALIEPLPDGSQIEAWLVGVARLELPMTHLLTTWRASRASGAIVQLAAFASEWAGDKREMVPPYWKDVPERPRAIMRHWLLSRDTMMQLVDGLGRIREEDRWALSGAVDRI